MRRQRGSTRWERSPERDSLPVGPRSARALPDALMALLALLFALPVIWSLINAFKPHTEIRMKPWALPSHVAWENFAEAWHGQMGLYLLNTTIVTGIAVIIILALSAPAAYAFARLKFRGSGALLAFIMGGLLIPVHAVLVPLYQFNPGTLLLKRLAAASAPMLAFSGRFGDWIAVLGPYIAFGLPLTVIMLRAYFIGIPKELSDAATMDGCTHARTLWSIFLPVARPALATVAIFQAAWIWNELVLAMVFIDQPLQKTLTVGLMGFQGEHSTDWGVVMAGVFMAVVPVLLLYFVFQKHIVRGLTAGAVK